MEPPAQPPATPGDQSAASPPAPGQATSGSGDTTMAGSQIYSQYCQTCHGASGTGDGPAAAALEPKPRDFSSGDFKFDANDNGEAGEPEDLAMVVRNGAAQYGGSASMTAWGAALGDREIEKVVDYVLSLSEGQGGADQATRSGAGDGSGGAGTESGAGASE